MNWIAVSQSLRGNFETLLHKLLISLLVIIGITILLKLAKQVIRLSLKNGIAGKYMDEARRKTISFLLENIASYILYGIGVFYILTVFFGTVGITVAGIVSVAIGFGAQNFIKDILSGIFIIFENKFQVDDYIRLDKWAGYVEKIGIRTTVLRDANGDMHIIPNGNIEELTNLSRKNRRLLADVIVNHGQSVDEINRAVTEAVDEFNETHDKLIGKAVYKGIIDITEIGPKIRVQAYTDFESSFDYEFELKNMIYASLFKNGIKAPELFNFQRKN